MTTSEMRRCYLSRVGKVYGPWRVSNVVHDDIKGGQIWTISCTTCGFTKTTRNGKDYARGRYGSCENCRKLKKESKLNTQAAAPKRENPGDYIGKIIGNRVVESYTPGKGLLLRCKDCGLSTYKPVSSVKNESVQNCRHYKKYSDPSYIGKRVGHLTIESYTNSFFTVVCDCGERKEVLGGNLFNGNPEHKCCDSKDCPFRYKNPSLSASRRSEGISFEKEMQKYYEKKGFLTKRTQDSGDFGADIILQFRGKKAAVQCKNTKSPATVSAVQEVYAAAAFYNCDIAVAVSPSGFTMPAIRMAKAIGVQLSEKDVAFFEGLLPVKQKFVEQTIRPFYGHKLTWEVDGVTKTADEWCAEFNVSRNTVRNRIKSGMSVEEAITSKKNTFLRKAGLTADQVLKDCKAHGKKYATVLYRLRSGMSYEDALNKPLYYQYGGF